MASKLNDIFTSEGTGCIHDDDHNLINMGTCIIENPTKMNGMARDLSYLLVRGKLSKRIDKLTNICSADTD